MWSWRSTWTYPWAPSWTKVRDLSHPRAGALRLGSGVLQQARCLRDTSARSQPPLTSLTPTALQHASCTLAVSDGSQPRPADNTCAAHLRHHNNTCPESLTSQVRVPPPCAPMGIRQRNTAGASIGHSGDEMIASGYWVLSCPRGGTLLTPEAANPLATFAPCPSPPQHSLSPVGATPLAALTHKTGLNPAFTSPTWEFSQPCFLSSPTRDDIYLPAHGVQQTSPRRPHLERSDTTAYSSTPSLPWTRRASIGSLDPAMARGKRLLRRHRPRDTARQRARPPQQVRRRQQDGEGSETETVHSSSSSEPDTANARAEGGDRSDQVARRNSTRPLTVFSVTSSMRPAVPRPTRTGG